MRAISAKIRKQFKKEKCHCCPNLGNEKHHALIYAGKQIDELFAIISLCTNCHRGNNGTIFADVKEKCELHAIKKGLEILKIKYPKFNWVQRMQYLIKKYEDNTSTLCDTPEENKGR